MLGQKERLMNRMSTLLLLLFWLLALAGKMSGFTFLVLIIATGLMFYANRCPNCKTYFRGLYWSKKRWGIV